MKIFLVKSLLLGALFLGFSCQNQKNEPEKKSEITQDSLKTTSKVVEQKYDPTVYFRATGTEPFWALEIKKESIVLRLMEDTIQTPHANPIKAMDANVKRYNIQTEATHMTIQVSQTECINAMSGQKFPYSVQIAYGSSKGEEKKVLEGCGQYISDYRLHDIWVLESLNGESLNQENYSQGLPNLEIQSKDNTFTGFTGCNQMRGKFFFEPELIRFTNISTTKKMCVPPNGQEQELLQAMKATTTYKIENNRFICSNPDQELLVFKKID